MRLVLRSKRRIRARVSTPARKRPYSTSAPLLVSCLHSLKILSTKEGQRGILKLLSLTPSTRRWGRLSFRPPYGSPPEKGRSSYLCNYGLCWPLFRSSTLFSLFNRVLPNKTDFWPTREGLWSWTRYEEWIYICVRYGSCWPAAAQLFERNTVVVGSDSTRVECLPGRRSSTVGSRRVRFGSRARTRNRRCTILAAMYVNLDLRDSSNGTHTQRRTTSSGLDETENISIKKLLGVSSERKSPAFIHIHSLVY